MLSLILIPLTIMVFLRLSKHYQFIVFSLVALYPFTFGDLGPIPDVLVMEWLGIIALLTLINRLVNVNSINKDLKKIRYKGVGIFIFALILLIIWVIIGFVNNQFLTKQIVIGNGPGTRRTYFDIFNNVILFFTTIIFFVTQYENIDVERFLKAILYVTIVIGFVRTFTFYFGINTPFMSGLYTYNTGAMTKYTGVSYRFSGLDYAAEVGIPALFGLYVYKNKLNLFALVILLIFVFLSGGRTIMVGILVSIVVFSFLFLPKNFVYLIFGLGILFAVAVILLPHSFLEGQLGRFSDLKAGKFMGQDAWRGMAWYLYLKTFVAHPIFGKGIGDYGGFIYSSLPGTEKFARAQLTSGGHGAYFSVLSTLGLGGIVYFIILMFGGIILSYKKIRQYAAIDINKTAVAIFCFMFLTIASIDCITGHNGLTDVPFLFYCVGLICSLRVLENNSSTDQGQSDYNNNLVRAG